MPADVKRAALYARVSTNDTEVIVLGEFVDTASADDPRGRREWRRLLELALRRQVDLIVVWKLDRAFRSVVDGATTLQTLRTAGCGIRSLQESWIDTTTPIGEAMYHITLAWAQLEKQQLTERVKAGMHRAQAEGKRIGRPPRPRPVTAHPQWTRVLQALATGHLTRAEAAKKLRVRKAALLAVLAAQDVDIDVASTGSPAAPLPSLSEKRG